MMDFGIIEQEIVDLLNQKIVDPDIEIEAIGENDADYILPFGKRKIIVAFSNEEPDPSSKSMDMVHLPTFVVFSILLQSKTVRGPNGIYQVSNLVKKYLTGYQPSDGSPFMYAGFRFEQKVKNTFEYSLDFKTKAIVVQQVSEEAGPQFKGLTFI